MNMKCSLRLIVFAMDIAPLAKASAFPYQLISDALSSQVLLIYGVIVSHNPRYKGFLNTDIDQLVKNRRKLSHMTLRQCLCAKLRSGNHKISYQ